MKIKIITCVFILLLINIFFYQVLAKYVISETIEVGTINIDRTNPTLQVSYSTKDVTSENVVVTIIANEQIEEVNGWILQDDKKTLKKEYTKNTQEEIEIKDISGNITRITIQVNNIDKEVPTISIEKIINSNTEYPNYANKNTTITCNIIIEDNRKILESLEKSDIKILVNKNEITPSKKIVTIQEDTETKKKLLLTLSGIEEEGNLVIKIPKNSVKDEIGFYNEDIEKDTEIQIDNTKPQVEFLEKEIENEKIEAQITANEKIRNLEGWIKENDKLIKKVFVSNVSYITEIEDLAGNKESIEIDVTKATNVILSYASHNSEIGWTYGYGNHDIAGLEAIKENPKYKTESLAFGISGNIEPDFMQAKAYVYTHWGEGSAAICHQSNQIYYHGWNPSNTEWFTLLSKENIILQGKKYIQFGGTLINGQDNTDINGKNPIPTEISKKYRYGISGIQLRLKDDSQYSIVYQIYVDEVGWIKSAKNGEVECYKNDKPISALRIALVPNSEVEELIATWDKDVRKIYKLTCKNH